MPCLRVLAPKGYALLAGVLLSVFALSSAGQAAESEFERLTRLARAGDPACLENWTYSRGLDRCICIKAGYSKQWGQCLPMQPGLAGRETQEGSEAMTSALPSPSTTGALPEPEKDETAAAPSAPVTVSPPPVEKSAGVEPPRQKLAEAKPAAPKTAESKPAPKAVPPIPKDPAMRMERIAQVQDCLAALGFYDGAVDGEADKATRKAFRRFARKEGLPAAAGLFGIDAQAALEQRCGDRWASVTAD